MTNAERYRRHLAATDTCQVCNGGVETILHILRDCPAMSGIWERIVPRGKRQAFFASSLLVWIFENLGMEETVNGAAWSTLFSMGVWWGWKWRCGNVFGENRICRDRVRFILDLAKEVDQANLACVDTPGRRTRVETMISWKKPPENWFKLNTDGASRGVRGVATAGGVVRNSEGEWCKGFSLHIGRCSAPLAELWGVYYGLVVAWELRITRLEVEIDSELVVGFLKKGIEESHPLSFLIRLCYGLLAKDWIVRVSHVYREANRLTDGLADHAFLLPLGFHALDTVPLEVDSILRDDVMGVSCPRHICL